MTGTGSPSPAGVIWLGGRMTEEAVRSWEAAVHRLWEGGPCPATLDLGSVTLLTCAAVDALARTSTTARRAGARLELRDVPQQSARLLHWAQLDHLITSYRGTRGRAVAAEWAAVATPPDPRG